MSLDPFVLLAPELSELRLSIQKLIDSGHPTLSEASRYYFLHPSKQIRPLIIFLCSRATNGLGRGWEASCVDARGRQDSLNMSLSRPDVLNDWNPSMSDFTSDFNMDFNMDFPLRPSIPHHSFVPSCHSAPLANDTHTESFSPTYILPTQVLLAQIIEMAHTASLLHDDVVDGSSLRRGFPSAPAEFGNKLAVNGGSFLVGRVIIVASRLGNEEVLSLVTDMISDLVEGEILQLKKTAVDAKSVQDCGPSAEAWRTYLQKTYLKTGSLIARSAMAAVILGGCGKGEIWRDIAYAYGRNLGIAFQLADDILDYESISMTLGKPSGADLQLGLTTAPALYAWEEHPEMGKLIQRKFKNPGDVELARDYVMRSSALQRARALAQAYADKAKEVLTQLPESEAKTALGTLADIVVGRKN